MTRLIIFMIIVINIFASGGKEELNKRKLELETLIKNSNNKIDEKLLESYASILCSKIFFYDEDGKKQYLKNLKYSDYKLKILSYTLVDMDGDKEPELLINTTLGAVDFVEVFHRLNNKVIAKMYGGDRQMRDIKVDGTYIWSCGAGNWGVGKISFENKEFNENEISYIESSVAGNTHFFVVENKRVEEKDFDKYMDKQNMKENAVWINY